MNFFPFLINLFPIVFIVFPASFHLFLVSLYIFPRSLGLLFALLSHSHTSFELFLAIEYVDYLDVDTFLYIQWYMMSSWVKSWSDRVPSFFHHNWLANSLVLELRRRYFLLIGTTNRVQYFTFHWLCVFRRIRNSLRLNYCYLLFNFIKDHPFD